MNYFACILAGYLVGAINPSYLIGKLKGFDIRERGSGNAGGSNALITMGKLTGLLCIFFDILKAFFVIRIMMHFFPDFDLCYPITACACMIGHMFPFYIGFRGGKALACLAGSILALSPVAFLILLVSELTFALMTNYIVAIPLSLIFIYPMMYGLITENTIGLIIIIAAMFVILLKHIENIKRIISGKEVGMSYLWNKEKEEDKYR